MDGDDRRGAFLDFVVVVCLVRPGFAEAAVMDVQGKSVLVIGLGSSGQAAAKLLAGKGAQVTCVDENKNEDLMRARKKLKKDNIETVLGCKKAPATRRFDLAILSPGIDPARPLVMDVAKSGVPVIGELEAGFLFCRCPLVALTGTNGKTTTTELIDSVFRMNGRRSMAVGNIGTPLTEACLKSEEMDVLVVEVSSFQLETIRTFRPRVSLMMNITPDHFDRYPNLEAYARAKARIWENQTEEDWAVVNIDSEKLLAGLGAKPHARVVRYALERSDEADFWCEGTLIFERGRGQIFDLKESRLRGQHNAENVMAALAVALTQGLDERRSLDAIRHYKPQAHRLETVRVLNGVEYVNDSKATNIDAMEKALTAFDRPILLIAGGKDKGFDFSTVTHRFKDRVKVCILIGDMAGRMNELWNKHVRCVLAGTLEEAVKLAANEAVSGDIVMLSPGCSSYDQFKNYEHRGEAFRNAVKKLK
jgi:UDP-N-acetylmuramoylalanine--D-glutamate ligase